MKYLYKITNNTNGMAYIGQTNDFKTRMAHHKKPNNNTYISRAIRKYGKENFSFQVLAIFENDMIDEMEQKAIVSFNTLSPNGYNLEGGGESKKILSEKTRQALRDSHLGKPSPRKGIPLSQEVKDKVSIGLKKYFDNNPQAKKDMSERRRGTEISNETKNKMQKSGQERYKNMTDEQKKELHEKQHNSRRKSEKVFKNNSTGYRGVCKKCDRFYAYINLYGKRYSVGYFDTAEEAFNARKIKIQEISLE